MERQQLRKFALLPEKGETPGAGISLLPQLLGEWEYLEDEGRKSVTAESAVLTDSRPNGSICFEVAGEDVRFRDLQGRDRLVSFHSSFELGGYRSCHVSWLHAQS